ncbi:MAG: flavodoxin family protein [Desulfobacteraceae bacterium]|nr:MAG: flavodoxin family protein [Desulfobacteraceae bacterium]
MKVLVLMGSPRKKGNTAKITGWVKDEMVFLGHDVDYIYLNEKNISGCMSCASCKDQAQLTACIQKDETPQILQKMAQADLILFASPVYFWGFTAQMKALIDRTFSLYSKYNQPGHSSLIQGKKTALLVTGGGAFKDNAEPLFLAFDRIQKPWKTIKSGEMFIGPCTTPDKLGDNTMDKARQFANKICQ